MFHKRKWTRLAAGVLALSLVTAACGNDDESSSDTTQKTDESGGGNDNSLIGMIHGGVRYLEKDRDVTRHSCEDSGFIQAMAPHLLFRIPFLFPVSKWTKKSRTLLELAFVFFQAYDQFQPLKRGKQLDPRL